MSVKMLIRYLTLIFLTSGLLSACSQENKWVEYKFSGAAMGTQWKLTLVDNNPDFDSTAIELEVAAEIERLEAMMSHYRADSELSKLNNTAPNNWHGISQELYEVLALSRRIADKTFGVFDVTLGAIVNEWGFGSIEQDTDSTIPDSEKLKELLKNSGWNRYHLQNQSGSYQFAKTSVFQLDVSAIAKGYSVDKVAELLQSQGLNNFLVDIGGEVKVSGHNISLQEWLIAIEKPVVGSINTAQKVVRLTDRAIATSGNYRNFKMVDGKQYSHIIDHRTGNPRVSRLVSATVISQSAAKADAWATAMMNLEPKAGLSYAKSESLPVMLVVEDEDAQLQTMMSQSFKDYLQE